MKFKQDIVMSPITITLETEDEVNRLFAVLNHTDIFDAAFSGCEYFHRLHGFLDPLSVDYEKYHTAINKKFKARFGKKS
jgi:hypothetical protein